MLFRFACISLSLRSAHGERLRETSSSIAIAMTATPHKNMRAKNVTSCSVRSGVGPMIKKEAKATIAPTINADHARRLYAFVSSILSPRQKVSGTYARRFEQFSQASCFFSENCLVSLHLRLSRLAGASLLKMSVWLFLNTRYLILNTRY